MLGPAATAMTTIPANSSTGPPTTTHITFFNVVLIVALILSLTEQSNQVAVTRAR
jgi:hypothetical protein